MDEGRRLLVALENKSLKENVLTKAKFILSHQKRGLWKTTDIKVSELNVESQIGNCLRKYPKKKHPRSPTTCLVCSQKKTNLVQQIHSNKNRQLKSRVLCVTIFYLSNAVDLFLICLSDVEDACVGQGDGGGALQGSVDSQLTKAVVNAWHLTMHWPSCNDAHLWATMEK